MRPVNEFALAAKSQLAVITEESGPAVKRYFGKWNSAFNRFTTNLTSVKIKVTTLEPDERRSDNGVMCILHWVDRKDMVRSDKGSVCYGDGWPTELWDTFTSQLSSLPKGSIAEKLKFS
ncbi:MAG TPA: hypothetical protein VFF30_10645 [Nitrososphaerales archaeon]|nr:hypothetical protein [Nitrososphaerales archaeon]